MCLITVVWFNFRDNEFSKLSPDFRIKTDNFQFFFITYFKLKRYFYPLRNLAVLIHLKSQNVK